MTKQQALSNSTKQLKTSKKVFFASDFHLGAPSLEASQTRERKILRWLNEIKPETGALFLLGDVFDFWFEYRHVVPRGFVRLQGKLAEFTDEGIPVYLFVGNHDLWMFDYFPSELNIPVFYQPQVWQINGTQFLLGHGDGLGPGDHTYKMLKKLFTNRLAQWSFARLHPNFAIGLARYFSRRSRQKNLKKQSDEQYLGDKEWLVQYCRQVETQQHHDFYIFGHRHLPLDVPIGENSRYINTGEWLKHFTYAVFDGNDLALLTYEND